METFTRTDIYKIISSYNETYKINNDSSVDTIINLYIDSQSREKDDSLNTSLSIGNLRC